ncbi:glycosyltransferase [Acidovorax sp. GBBC 3334]|uniref:glycosyltransferase n=1 Tax=unclassified Acidovorax TaxID=2684926 RepID=UPI002303B518|nr:MULTISPECIES: glycosyltransferase [unclassified Acidovorax]MDA8454084.1 glycosyltransferase [Acidovorax sp. GBBC 3334]MDA8519458.1 glycosyltransferase [Acidovorax sp. NCPPB 4044]
MALKGVVLYDFLHAKGGAERLTLDLVRGLEGTELCYGYRQPEVFSAGELAGIACHDLEATTPVPGWRTLKVLRAFAGRRAAFLDRYDWAIYSGVLAPVAVRHRKGQRNLYYCHTPPRFVYDLRDYYRDKFSPLLRPALAVLAAYLKQQYEASVAAMDVVIANSENVRSRLRTHLGVESRVVHPPIDVERFRWRQQGDYFLSLARLEDFKRVELIVDAFLRMPSRQLVVVSGGSQFEMLRAKAASAPNIRFTSWLGDEALAELMGGARASIYIPRDEDFGMSPVESMAAGKPVIGVAEGGLLETIVPGETGWLLPAEPTVDQLIESVMSLSGDRAAAMRTACESRAQVFSKDRFLQKMKELVAE